MKRDCKKLLVQVRQGTANTSKAWIGKAEYKNVVRQGLRVIQDEADNAEDSLESVTIDEDGHSGLKALLERLTESHLAVLQLLEKCCPRAVFI